MNRIATLLSAATCILAGCLAPAKAGIVTFSTAGSCFAASAATTVCATPPAYWQAANSEGDLATLTFTSVQSQLDFSSLSRINASLGTFQLSYLPAQSGDVAPVTFTPVSFLLSIAETTPSSSAHLLVPVTVANSDSLAGTVTPGGTDLQATFDPGYPTGTITLQSFYAAPFEFLVAPSSNAGQTTVQARLTNSAQVDFGSLNLNLVIDQLAAPEPVSGLLAACGLIALGSLRRRPAKPARATPHIAPPAV